MSEFHARDMEYAQRLARMIRVETISTYAGAKSEEEIEKFRRLQSVMRELFPHVYETMEIEDFDGSLLFRWKGKSAGQPILFMNHQDVVAADGEWIHPPFAGVIENGKLYGRGTLDTKGGLFCMLSAAEELIAEGFVPERDIYFESARTEECNGDGAQIIAKELLRRGIRFAFSLDEGGMIVREPMAGAKGTYALIGVGEKGAAKLRFIAKSNGGHASRPPKNTPLVRLGKFMAAVDRKKIFRIELAPVVKEMFSRLAKTMRGPLKFLLGHPTFFSPLLKALLPAVSPAAKAMLSTTVAFTMAQGSEANNVLPQQAWVVGDMRFSHHQGREASFEAIRKLAAKYQVETEVLEPGYPSPLADFKNERFRKIEEAVKTIFPNVETTPYLAMAASDNRFMSVVSDLCYGFVPFRVTNEQLGGVHGLNECVDISCLAPAIAFYKEMMK